MLGYESSHFLRTNQ